MSPNLNPRVWQRGLRLLVGQVRDGQLRTLRWRLTLLYTSLMAFLLIAISISVYTALQAALYRSLRNDLASNLNQVAGFLESSRNNARDNWTGLPDNWNGFPGDSYGEVNLFDAVPAVEDLVALSQVNGFYNRNGSRSRSLGEYGAFLELPKAAYEALLRDGRYNGPSELKLGRDVIPVLMGVRYSETNTRLGNGFMIEYVAKSTTPILNIMQTMRAVLVFVSLIGLAAAGLGAYWLAGRGLEPIRAVRDAASKISGSSLSSRVPVQHTRDEVEDLARTLNHMLERLEQSFEAQRRFTADASHELRTPVTAINGHASYLLRRTNPSIEQRESLTAISTLGNRLSGLIGDLLDLARADAGLAVQPVEVGLLGLAEDVHLEVVAIAGKAEIQIFGSRNLIVLADPNRVRQVIRNLVQNAIKAGSSQIHVRVGLDAHLPNATDPKATPWVILSVQDNGPGIAPEHLKRLFDRFYRVDTARDRAAGGSGLGLSIVKWIVEAHQGTVQINSQVGVGTRVDVRFALARVAPETHASNMDDDVA